MLKEKLKIPIEGAEIESTLHKPSGANKIVIVSHAPGSGRFNKRNKRLIDQFDQSGLATLLCDWNHIKRIQVNRDDFNPYKMAEQLSMIVKWLQNHRSFKDLSIALFGSGTGAAFSIIAASELGDGISAIVTRNGWLDLADDHLDKVKAPTFVAVGEKDYSLLERNKKAYSKLECPKRLVVVPGITPFFEKSKNMNQMGQMSIDWIKNNSLDQNSSKVFIREGLYPYR